MSENQTPLEKQLFHMDLSKGVNERERPETAPPSTTMTRVENLYQDQTGGFIKRYGTTVLGNTVPDPTRLVRLREGLGLIANKGHFYHYQEAYGQFLQKDQLPEFTASADFIASSGPSVTPKIIQVASCTAFHAMVVDYTAGAGGVGQFLILFDREASAVVARYDLYEDFTPGTIFSTPPLMAFVGNRYLHVYMTAPLGTGLYGFVIDTGAAMPASPIVPTLLDMAGDTVIDIAVHADRSIVLYFDSTTNNILSMNSAAAFIESYALAGALQISDSGDKLWYSTATHLGAQDPTSLSTVLVASAAHTGPSPATFHMTATSGNVVYWVAQVNNTTFGAGTIHTIKAYTTAANGTTLTQKTTTDGWSVASAPFEDAVSGKVFLHVTKDTATTVVPHAIVCISSIAYNSFGSNVYYSVRVACNLEPNIGVANSSVLRYFSPDGIHICPAVPISTTERGYGYAVFNLKSMGHADTAHASFGGATHISGGCHSTYAGDVVNESGYVDVPRIDTSSTGTGLTGSYKYVAVFRSIDEVGSVTWSRCSSISSITISNKSVAVKICPANVSNRDRGLFASGNAQQLRHSVELYRTITGGTIYYLVGSSQIGTPATGLATQAISLASTRFFTVTDSMTDANLILQPTLFRQPGTPNAAVDRYSPPGGNIILQHKDRLFTVDPCGLRVYYSSFFVDGENAWFNPAFSFFVHGASGPITGLASMDGRLFIFKRNGIFVVDGDGPPEGGPNGSEYSPPQRLSTEYGCTDHRSIQVTTDGIIYMSHRGVEILTRSLQVKWLGEPVHDTVDANPKVCGAYQDSFGRYHLALGASDTGTATQAGVSGVEMVYDSTSDCWTISHHSDYSGTYNACLQDICRADLSGLGDTLCYVDPSGYVVREDYTSGLDRGQWFVPWVIETGWIRVGQQSRQRISNLLFLAKKRAGNHAIKMSVAYDYVDSYTQVHTWEPDVLNALDIEELAIKPTKPLTLAIRLKIEEQVPADVGTYPIGVALGAASLGISAEVAAVSGAPFANRGTVGTLTLPPIVTGISPATGSQLGGTGVTIYGANFTAGTTFTLGGVALTSVVLVDVNTITAVTPSGTGTVDLVGNNGGGVSALANAYTYASTAFDPATLVATMWYRTDFSAAPWAETASSGASLWMGPATALGSSPGTFTVNGHDAADFDGSSTSLKTTAPVQVLFTPTAGGIFCLLNMDTQEAPSAHVYSDPSIIQQNSAGTGITANTSGISAFAYSGGYQVVTKAMGTGSWHLVMMRWDGANLGLTMDSDPEDTTPIGVIDFTNDDKLNIGYRFGGAPLFDGKIAELMTFSHTPSPADFVQFKSYCNARYGLSL